MKKKTLALLLTAALLCTGTVQYVSAENAETTETTETTNDAADSTTTEDTITDETTTEVGTCVAASGISKDSKGRMYIADRIHHVLYRRSTSGKYTILAGTYDKSGKKTGTAENALFNSPWDVVAYGSGWAISDSENHVIRLYKNEKVTTLAGAGKIGYKNAKGKSAKFNRPTGMAAGTNGEIYVADTGNNVIRKIDKNGKVTLYAGGKQGCASGSLKNARFNEPTGLYYYKGTLYVADSGNHRICKIANGKVTTVAGSSKGVEGDKNASALKARFSNPQEIYWYQNVMYISDTGNGAVKCLSNGKVTTIVNAFSMDDGLAPAEPCGLMIYSGKLYVGDIFAEKLLEVER